MALLERDVQLEDWRKIFIALLKWTIVLMTSSMIGAGLWASIDPFNAAFNNSASLMNSLFTCAADSM